MTQTPILFVGDAPSLKTGLARIGRDLASLTATLPEFRVGYLGRGGLGTRQVPFACYSFPEHEGFGNEAILNQCFRDFAGDKSGIVFVISDVSRYYWLVSSPWVQTMRLQGKLKLWIYAPVDSAGVNGKLTPIECDILKAFDRVLAYGEYGAEILVRSMGASKVPWLPHGINMDVFQPRDRQAARIAMGYSVTDKVMGMVATNQARKDWGVAIAALAQLPGWKMWAHIDVLQRHWDLAALIHDFGVQDRIKATLTGSMNDTELSYFYSGCDLTILPSQEGFGYPLAESLACGTPTCHPQDSGGRWAFDTGGCCPISENMARRLEGLHHRYRLILSPNAIHEAMAHAFKYDREKCRAGIEVLDWKRLWPARWSKFMLEGLS